MIVARIVGSMTVICLAAGAAFAAGSHSGNVTDGKGSAPYAGQQERAIKSLSAEDVEALKAGQGWGFAKAAELNGYPGPLHVLELDKELNLSDTQRRQIKAIYTDMQASARQVGADFLAAERELDLAFTHPGVTAETVSALTSAAGRLRAKLRAVHLNAHLATTPLLTKAQLHRYNRLRGYAGGDHGSQGSHSGAAKGSHSGH